MGTYILHLEIKCMDAIASMKYITIGQNYTHPLPVLVIFILTFKNEKWEF